MGREGRRGKRERGEMEQEGEEEVEEGKERRGGKSRWRKREGVGREVGFRTNECGCMMWMESQRLMGGGDSVGYARENWFSVCLLKGIPCVAMR